MTVIIISLAVLILLFFLFNSLKRKKETSSSEAEAKYSNGECCGAHEVCEKESLLNKNAEIIYYDDEELDELSNMNSKDYSDTQLNLLSEVFYTLKESDVAGWLRSLQMRNIELPEELKDEALLIVRERRGL